MTSSDSLTIVEVRRRAERERLPFLWADCLEVFPDEEDYAAHCRACVWVSAPRLTA